MAGKRGPSREEKIAELTALGIAPSDQEAHLARHGYGKDADVLEVWEQHEEAMAVFGLCQFNAIATMAGAHYLGIAATEIAAVAGALRLELTGELIDDVQTIARGAMSILNGKK